MEWNTTFFSPSQTVGNLGNTQSIHSLQTEQIVEKIF